jgi:hypothetical protein
MYMISRIIASDAGFGGRPEQPRMKLLGFKPFVKNSLRGFVEVELGIGLQIKGATLQVTEGRAWIGMPARPMIGADGQPIINQTNGKPAYQPILGWRNKALSDAFSKAVVKLILEQHPDALDGAE